MFYWQEKMEKLWILNARVCSFILTITHIGTGTSSERGLLAISRRDEGYQEGGPGSLPGSVEWMKKG